MAGAVQVTHDQLKKAALVLLLVAAGAGYYFYSHQDADSEDADEAPKVVKKKSACKCGTKCKCGGPELDIKLPSLRRDGELASPQIPTR